MLSGWSSRTGNPAWRERRRTSPLVISPKGKRRLGSRSSGRRLRKYDWSLPAVHPPEQARSAVAGRVNPGVMARGQVGKALPLEILPEAPELDGGVAPDAGVGSAAPGILGDKIIQHFPGEFPLQVDHPEGNSEALGQGFNPVRRRGQGREAQVDGVEVPALATQEGGGHGAVHPAAQSDGHFTAGRHGGPQGGEDYMRGNHESCQNRFSAPFRLNRGR